LRAFWFKESKGLSSSLDRLKGALHMNARLFKEKKAVVETLLKGIDFTDKFYIEVFKEIHDGWRIFYNGLIEECKKENYIDRNIETDKAIAILVGSLMHYSKHCEMYGCEDYYGKVNEFIDFLIEKIK
jgi:hypothetical protein